MKSIIAQLDPKSKLHINKQRIRAVIQSKPLETINLDCFSADDLDNMSDEAFMALDKELGGAKVVMG